MKKFGIWKQFKPKQILDGERYIKDEFSLYVKAFTKQLALELIQKNPKFKQDKEGNERQGEEVLIELQQRVHFRIVEQFELEVLDNKAGYKIPLER